ncbi:unnamed protein product [Didymodactylos carnosus]|uniref:nitric-oxide synthase (NADPH) n=1 Tax=Didymodactylos carnosus TaxID=1234261 RepID=A0A815CI10_9BILA|nr:unnamed protein product [Didymodactylos carnosus]CAF4090800.1 unnamed protein product [Didymodactylos carnosus]
MVLMNGDKCPFINDKTFTAINGPALSPNGDHNTSRQIPETKSKQLRNYQSGQSIEVSCPVSDPNWDCRHHVCTSTLMSLATHAHENKSSNEHATVESESMSPDKIRKEAYDFLSIFHTDKGTSDTDYQNRLHEIDREIQQTGTYTQTFDEIEYGCQLAWRNAARCINRLFWRKLKVIDRRHVQTHDEMFKEICDHMRLAFNKGTLQATTLVFGRGARTWSTQYLRYACYEQVDGSLLGDPANRELTKAAMEIGWNKREKERTQWDVLPIIVQCDPDVPPSWYDLPKDLQFQVFLSHPDPKYDAAIRSLGLRWFAQPFVSDKAIEIGGIVYQCVPFSGWFMQTEVGRNLCDLQRYNFIPKLANLLNLDVTAAANSQLNIDRIYVEINAAVLYSFEQAKVAIVDHHTAATGFMKFLDQEVKQRGNTPADWIWLVPPISGGMSTLFHQEMLNYVVKPRVLDQRDPWTYYAPFQRKKPALKMSLTNTRHRWLIVRAGCTIIGFALRAVRKRVFVNVLYASASGTAQSYAEQMIKRLMTAGYNAKLMELDSYSFEQPSTQSRSIVFIITSTFGQGNAPDGGQMVEEWLQEETNEDDTSNNNDKRHSMQMHADSRSTKTGKVSLKRYTYAVCAIGSSAYPFFCGFGKLVDRAFQQLGGQRLVPFATCDALNQQYKSYTEWEETTIIALKKMYPHTGTVIHPARSTSIPRPPSLQRATSYVEQQVNINISVRPTYIPLKFHPDSDEISRSEQVGPFTKDNPFSATVIQNIELTGANNIIGDPLPQESQPLASLPSAASAHSKKLPIPSHFTNVNNDEYRSVRLLILDSTGLTYYPGDHVCILPENTLANVNGVILACGWQLGNKLLNESCSLESFTNGKYKTLRQILTHFVDLTTTPRPHTLNTFATYATDPSQQRQILELGKGGQRYMDWLVNLPTVKEMLEQFPSIQIPLDELIQPYILFLFSLFIFPFFLIYIDKNLTIYIADTYNNRIVKWIKNSDYGILVAGGNGAGSLKNQLYWPSGVYVHETDGGTIYIADSKNERIQQWLINSTEGRTIAGSESGISGLRLDQLSSPVQIKFDKDFNLYVVDIENARILKFNLLHNGYGCD